MILALAGGVGGAKLAEGLAAVLPDGALTVVVNTGDDFEHLGLHISPDIDTITYTLAGINNREQGWGIEGETWNFMSALERMGGETWFRLGDRDLATHVERTRRLKSETLSAITADFAKRLGIRQNIVPMTDDRMRTIVLTDEGRLTFQEYFVQRACKPKYDTLTFEGLGQAKASPGVLAALNSPDLEAIVICPSNPFLSILPIVGVRGIRELLDRRRVPIVAVSPIVGGKAIKGPAAKMMREHGWKPSAVSVARYYFVNLRRIADGFVIDKADARLAGQIKGPETLVTDTIMRDRDDKIRLATEVLDFAKRVSPPPNSRSWE